MNSLKIHWDRLGWTFFTITFFALVLAVPYGIGCLLGLTGFYSVDGWRLHLARYLSGFLASCVLAIVYLIAGLIFTCLYKWVGWILGRD